MANLNLNNVNQRDDNNRTLLHINVFQNKSEVVKNLLLNSADASLTSNKGNTPLHTATSRKNHRLVEILLKYSRRDQVRKFIDAKTTESGSTALHVAASNGCIESVRHLLCYGANFEVKNKTGKRPIDVATDEKVKMLLANVEFDAKLAAEGDYRKLQIILYKGYSKADLKASVYARDNNGMTSLQVAVIKNHCNTVYRIIETRVDRLQEGELAITDNSASADEFIELGRAVSARHLALMMHAEDVNVIGAKGMTEEVAIMLGTAQKIVRRAEEVFKPANGEPYEQSSLLACVEETLEALEFEPEHVAYNKAGKFVFRGHNARYYKMLRGKNDEDDGYDNFKNEDKIVSYMGILQVGISRAIAMFMRTIFTVKMNIAVSENDLEMFEKCIEERYIDVNVLDHNGRRPLHHAANNGNEKMVKILLQKKAIVKQQDKLNEETALHLAAKKGHVGVIRLLLQSIRGEDLKTLVDMRTKNEGWTAVHFAAKSSRLDVLKCLLEFGATYNLQDKTGETPCGLSENTMVNGFLKGIVELFQAANNGDVSLLEKLRALKSDELVAIGHARNSSGCTIKNVAEMRGHRDLASQIAKVVEKVTPAAPKIDDRRYYEDHEIDGFRMMKTLSTSRT